MKKEAPMSEAMAGKILAKLIKIDRDLNELKSTAAKTEEVNAIRKDVEDINNVICGLAHDLIGKAGP